MVRGHADVRELPAPATRDGAQPRSYASRRSNAASVYKSRFFRLCPETSWPCEPAVACSADSQSAWRPATPREPARWSGQCSGADGEGASMRPRSHVAGREAPTCASAAAGAPICRCAAFSQIQLPREPDRGPGARSKGALRASKVRPARRTTTRPPIMSASTGGTLRVARATTAQEVKSATAATAPKTFHDTRRAAVRMSPLSPMT
jgi:hypothetical protein